jgi:hypothetical protein
MPHHGDTSMNKTLQRSFLLLLVVPLVAVAAWAGWRIYDISQRRAEIKKDYAVLNNVTYGLLSVNAWRDHLVRVVTNRIDDFEFSKGEEDTLKYEIEQVLHAVVTKADKIMDKKQKTVKGKIAKFAVKTFVNEEKIHEQVPVFAQTIVNELKKPANKEKLKGLAREKLSDFGSVTYDSVNDVRRVKEILDKYGIEDMRAYNTFATTQLDRLQEQTYNFTYTVLGMLVLFLALWWLLRKQTAVHTPLFVMSVVLALVVLLTGLVSPMIEIDARIKHMSFILIGERITFDDQVIFYQSKSIMEVVSILLETGKFDSMVVGVLILVFSVLFPIAKLLSTKIYLLGKERWRNNKVIAFFAFKSGKWSMADVNVVAIFMAYIGFKGILDSQLSNLNRKTESLASISTNYTSLQPGFIVFVGFVLFGLALSVILKKITEMQGKTIPE